MARGEETTHDGTDAPLRDARRVGAALPYTAPSVRRLGSIRELTFGMSGKYGEVGMGMQPNNPGMGM